MQTETKNCQNCKQNFPIELEDFAFYEKIKVPPPTFCPGCRMLRRLASINHRSLYKRNCDKCGESVASMYHPNSPFIVYCTKCYFSDDWDPMSYGREYDFSKPFFPQFYDFMKSVPQLHIEHTNNNGEGITFSNYIYRSSRIYLSYGIVRSEDILYSWGGENGNRMCIDCLNFSENENCYDVVDSIGNYASAFLTRSHQCIDSAYLFDSVNCTNCFMSANLRNRSYVFRNEQLSADEYKKRMKEYRAGSYQLQTKLLEEYLRLMKDAIHRFAVIIQSENCTGDFISNSKNVRSSFSVQDSENIKFVNITTNHVVDSYDLSMAGRVENSYELTVTGRGNQHSLFSYNIGHTEDVEYCDGCNYVKKCFGCVNLKQKEFCIFNTQYSESEYERLRTEIIDQMKTLPYVDEKRRVYTYGEYFPINFSRFTYNETAAFEFNPLTKDEIEAAGFRTLPEEKKAHVYTIESEEIPDSISNVTSDILNHTLPCAHKALCNEICTNAFRITQNELDMYRKLGIALPHTCPNCRYFTRMKSRTLPWKLWHRACTCTNKEHNHGDKCANEFETSYAPDRSEKVYCESCYQKEVL